MKAVLCKQHGPPEGLVIEDIPSRKPGDGEVVVSAKACGVNFPDTLIIQNKYQTKPELPFSPGGEIAGVVKELGEGVTGFRIGDRVFAYTRWGGFAEEVVLEASRLIAMPEGMDFVIASAFMMTYGTSHHALKDRAQLKAGERLLVLGAAGGVGLAAVEIGKVMGASVIAAASSEDKLALCIEHGADQVINYAREDLKTRIKEITSGEGVDVVYDPVGGDYSEAALRGTAWNGRFLVVGFAAGEIPRMPLNLPLLKGCSIVGVAWGTFIRREPQRNQQHLKELLTWFQEGTLKPHISGTYPLERAAEALRAMMDRNVKGKIVLIP
jgi:NADPH2:quinone reductase